MSPRLLLPHALSFGLILAPFLALPSNAQTWRPLLRGLYQTPIDAPEGIRRLTEPSPSAKVIKLVPGPLTFEAAQYVEIGDTRYYLDRDGVEAVWDERPASWIVVPGSGRAGFIAGTTPATLVKRETRDFFKAGPQTAEIYEETVNLWPEIDWAPDFRRAEVDFRLPAKVAAYRPGESGAWELDLTIYPAFESNEDRIPGPAPENWGEPFRALITRPVQRSVTLRGSSGGENLGAVFLPDTVWAAEMSEGRVQALRIGWHELEPPHEVSRLSAPHFQRGGRFRFRFLASRLLGDPVRIEVTPDRITGVDMTVYELIAALGGPPPSPDDAPLDELIHSVWNLRVTPDGSITVVTPLMEGRGAAGSLELESLGLGPTFEEDLAALAQLAKSDPPVLGTDEPGWLRVREEALGEIPMEQRGPETEF